jgi:hypothetical protein
VSIPMREGEKDKNIATRGPFPPQMTEPEFLSREIRRLHDELVQVKQEHRIEKKALVKEMELMVRSIQEGAKKTVLRREFEMKEKLEQQGVQLGSKLQMLEQDNKMLRREQQNSKQRIEELKTEAGAMSAISISRLIGIVDATSQHLIDVREWLQEQHVSLREQSTATGQFLLYLRGENGKALEGVDVIRRALKMRPIQLGDASSH